MSTLNTMVEHDLGEAIYALEATMPDGRKLVRVYATEKGQTASYAAISKSIAKPWGPASVRKFQCNRPQWMEIP